METYRLKNIVILILLLLNAFLLLLVAARYTAQLSASQELIGQTVALLEKNGIQIDDALLREDQDHPTAYSVERSQAEEAAFAAAFLGSALSVRDAGGGTDLYTASGGTIAFRSNGSFSLSLTASDGAITYYDDFIRDYCPSYYRPEETQRVGNLLTVSAVPYVKDLPVYGAAIEFTFTNDVLTSAAGYYIPSAEGTAQSADSVSRCSAVVSLMDYCHAEGRICNTITGISTGYVLQSTVSVPLFLAPVYKIDTNMISYYVNCYTGYVLPAK